MPDAATVTALCCASCGTLDPGPRELCASCGSGDLEPKEIPGTGKLLSWTVIRRAPTRFRGEAPYVIAVVDLDAGVRCTGRLRGEVDHLRLGAAVSAIGNENGAYVFKEQQA